MAYPHHLLSAAGGVGSGIWHALVHHSVTHSQPKPHCSASIGSKGIAWLLDDTKKHPSHRGDGRAPGFDEGFIGMPIVPVMGGGPL